MVVGIPAEPERLNPLTIATAEGFDLLQLVFTPLFRIGPDLEAPVPALVERWDTTRVAGDSLDVTLLLRAGVRWSDGRELTADDVAFTFRRIKDPRFGVPVAGDFRHYGERVETPDARTVRLRVRAHPGFLAPLVQLVPVPRHLLEGVEPDRLRHHPYGSEGLVGSGPFRFVRRRAGQEWTFEADPGHPAALGGRPRLDRLVLRVVQEPTTRLTELRTGGIDVMLAPSPAQAEQLGPETRTRAVSGPGSQILSVHWNTRRPVFRDPRVRRALSMAIERDGIVAAVYRGHARVGAGTARPADWHFHPGDGIRPDPEAARRLLEAAGWVDPDGDGVRRNGAGDPLEFALNFPSALPDHAQIATILQARLAAVGARVRLQPLEMNSWVESVAGTPDRTGRRVRTFDASLHGFYFWGPVDDGPTLHSRSENEMFGATGFRNARADALLDSLATGMDRERMRPLWREFQGIVRDEAPQTVLAYPDRLVGVRDRVQGVEVDMRGDFATAARWWVRDVPGP